MDIRVQVEDTINILKGLTTNVTVGEVVTDLGSKTGKRGRFTLYKRVGSKEEPIRLSDSIVKETAFGPSIVRDVPISHAWTAFCFEKNGKSKKEVTYHLKLHGNSENIKNEPERKASIPKLSSKPEQDGTRSRSKSKIQLADSGYHEHDHARSTSSLVIGTASTGSLDRRTYRQKRNQHLETRSSSAMGARYDEGPPSRTHHTLTTRDRENDQYVISSSRTKVVDKPAKSQMEDKRDDSTTQEYKSSTPRHRYRSRTPNPSYDRSRAIDRRRNGSKPSESKTLSSHRRRSPTLSSKQQSSPEARRLTMDKKFAESNSSSTRIGRGPPTSPLATANKQANDQRTATREAKSSTSNMNRRRHQSSNSSIGARYSEHSATTGNVPDTMSLSTGIGRGPPTSPLDTSNKQANDQRTATRAAKSSSSNMDRRRSQSSNSTIGARYNEHYATMGRVPDTMSSPQPTFSTFKPDSPIQAIGDKRNESVAKLNRECKSSSNTIRHRPQSNKLSIGTSTSPQSVDQRNGCETLESKNSSSGVQNRDPTHNSSSDVMKSQAADNKSKDAESRDLEHKSNDLENFARIRRRPRRPSSSLARRLRPASTICSNEKSEAAVSKEEHEAEVEKFKARIQAQHLHIQHMDKSTIGTEVEIHQVETSLQLLQQRTKGKDLESIRSDTELVKKRIARNEVILKSEETNLIRVKEEQEAALAMQIQVAGVHRCIAITDQKIHKKLRNIDILQHEIQKEEFIQERFCRYKMDMEQLAFENMIIADKLRITQKGIADVNAGINGKMRLLASLQRKLREEDSVLQKYVGESSKSQVTKPLLKSILKKPKSRPVEHVQEGSSVKGAWV